MIWDIILRSKSGDDNATLELIEKFKPLLRKYAYHLGYDDAYNDLLIDFIELIHNIRLAQLRDRSEGNMAAYICMSVRSSYIRRSKENKKSNNLVLYSQLSDEELYCIEADSAVSDIYFEYELFDIEKALTQPESSVVRMLYSSGYNVSEIARILGITRQAVNQMKKRALKKLKIFYGDRLYTQGTTT